MQVEPQLDGTEPGSRTPGMREVRFEYTPEFPRVLDSLGSALLVSTYQAGKLLVVGVHAGQLTFAFHDFERVMGVASWPYGWPPTPISLRPSGNRSPRPVPRSTTTKKTSPPGRISSRT
jgi:hypothetical protein